jgi:hypothetical protein
MKNKNIDNEKMNDEERKQMEFEVKETLNVIEGFEAKLEIMVNLGNNNTEAYLSLQQTVNDLREVLEDLLNQLESDDSTQEHYGDYTAKADSATSFAIKTPFGPLEIDLFDYDAAQEALVATRKKVEQRTFTEQLLFNFLGEGNVRESRYWPGNLGKLMKIHLDAFLDQREWDCVEEFSIERGRKVSCTYSAYDFPGNSKERYLVLGYRFFKHRTLKNARFVLEYLVDSDGDHRLSLIRAKSDIPIVEPGTDSPPTIIDEMNDDFYVNGPLNGEFFDIRYNFIDRDKSIEDLIAWDEEVKQLLWKDIVMFQQAMPALLERGIPNSRGIILAGPPGTGKTMMAKWLAAHSEITCVLISAEMIGGRHDIKRCYEIARKLSPSLLIIEDIDTAGALDRRAADHPLLGEFLQAMDGVVPNHGVITLATTNHSDKIDPAIADRPGRFDRIIEVGLPRKNQRYHILKQLLEKMDLDDTVDSSAINSLAKASDGLTGAWLRELVQSAFLTAYSSGENNISHDHLILSLKDVMKRRGMAYRVNGYSAENRDPASAYPIYD